MHMSAHVKHPDALVRIIYEWEQRERTGNSRTRYLRPAPVRACVRACVRAFVREGLRRKLRPAGDDNLLLVTVVWPTNSDQSQVRWQP